MLKEKWRLKCLHCIPYLICNMLYVVNNIYLGVPTDRSVIVNVVYYILEILLYKKTCKS